MQTFFSFNTNCQNKLGNFKLEFIANIKRYSYNSLCFKQDLTIIMTVYFDISFFCVCSEAPCICKFSSNPNCELFKLLRVI